jgi:heparan-alpha-glucosaminide N-acetyltransferase
MTAARSASATQWIIPPRLGSIDTYRGLVMFLMMAEVLRLAAVAAKAPNSWLLQFLAHHQSHVPWAGCSLHDLIQPSFSFLVGVSLPFSIASRIAKGQSRFAMFLHAILRAIILVLLGVFLRSMSAKQTNWTFEDTLSQIGFGYVPLFLLGFTRQRWQWTALVAILVGYWAAFALYRLPPSDFDYQSVGVPSDWPYHYSGLAAHWNKNSNLAWAFDTWFLNLFPRPKTFLFNSGGYATLSFIPTLGTMILGLIAGRWLFVGQTSTSAVSPHKPEAQARGPAAKSATIAYRPPGPLRTIGALMLTGLILLALGLLAHGSVEIPFAKGMENVSLAPVTICPCVKRIWTPSWTLYSGGWCFLILAGLYAVIDVARISGWDFPLRVIGANSIAAYLLAHGPHKFISDSLKLHFGAHWLDIFGPAYQPLVIGTAVLAIEWLILYWLYRKRIHIRI